MLLRVQLRGEHDQGDGDAGIEEADDEADDREDDQVGGQGSHEHGGHPAQQSPEHHQTPSVGIAEPAEHHGAGNDADHLHGDAHLHQVGLAEVNYAKNGQSAD